MMLSNGRRPAESTQLGLAARPSALSSNVVCFSRKPALHLSTAAGLRGLRLRADAVRVSRNPHYLPRIHAGLSSRVVVRAAAGPAHAAGARAALSRFESYLTVLGAVRVTRSLPSRPRSRADPLCPLLFPVLATGTRKPLCNWSRGASFWFHPSSAGPVHTAGTRSRSECLLLGWRLARAAASPVHATGTRAALVRSIPL